MKKSDCFFFPQAASLSTQGCLGLGAGAAPDGQRRRSAAAFRLAAGMLLMFLFCSLPLDFCGGGCFHVLTDGFLLLPDPGQAPGEGLVAITVAQLVVWKKWRSVSVQTCCAVAWLFGVAKSAPAGASCQHCAQRRCGPRVVLACDCLHKKHFPVQILRYRLPSLALSPRSSLECHPLLTSVAF